MMKVAYFTNENINSNDFITVKTGDVKNAKVLKYSITLDENRLDVLFSHKMFTDNYNSLIEAIKEENFDIFISDLKKGLGIFANVCACLLDKPLLLLCDSDNYYEYLDSNPNLYSNNTVKAIDASKLDNKDELKEAIDDYKYSRVIKKIDIKEDCITLHLLDFDKNEEKLLISIDKYNESLFRENSKITKLSYTYLKNKEGELLAYKMALKKLSINDHSIKEIRDSIYNKYKLSTKQIDNIINKLIKYNLLDDHRFAESKVSIYQSSLYSEKMMKMKLKKYGIGDDIIDAVVIENKGNEYSNAYTKANKYKDTIKNKSLRATKQNIYNKLVNEGFNISIVKEVINGLDFSSYKTSELEKLNKEANKQFTKYAKKYEGIELKSKVVTSLMTKGYDYNDICTVLNEMGI